jgi:hypothetical protein
MDVASCAALSGLNGWFIPNPGFRLLRSLHPGLCYLALSALRTHDLCIRIGACAPGFAASRFQRGEKCKNSRLRAFSAQIPLLDAHARRSKNLKFQGGLQNVRSILGFSPAGWSF